MNRRQLIRSSIAMAAAGLSVGYLGTNALASVTDTVVVEWVQHWNSKDHSYVNISLWVTPRERPRYRYIVGAGGIHFNKYDAENVDDAVNKILAQFKQNYSKEPWFEEALMKATDQSIDFYLE